MQMHEAKHGFIWCGLRHGAQVRGGGAGTGVRSLPVPVLTCRHPMLNLALPGLQLQRRRRAGGGRLHGRVAQGLRGQGL